MSASDLIRQHGVTALLAATLVIPALFVVLAVAGLSLWEPIIPVALAIFLAILAALAIDHLVQGRALKIAIATIAALLSILLGSLLIRSMTLVCDPVHDPGLVCDPVHVPETAPTVIATVQPDTTTPMIFDPVHEPGSCSGDLCQVAPVVTGMVAGKLDECRKSIGDGERPED